MTIPAQLIQLPNKDLYRPYTIIPGEEKPVEGATAIDPKLIHPMDAAIAAVLVASKGARALTCLWCGLQGDEKWIREHLTKNHPSVVTPAPDAAVALAAAAEAEFKKAEAPPVEE